MARAASQMLFHSIPDPSPHLQTKTARPIAALLFIGKSLENWPLNSRNYETHNACRKGTEKIDSMFIPDNVPTLHQCGNTPASWVVKDLLSPLPVMLLPL